MRSHTHTYRHLHAHMRTRSQTRPRTHTYTNTHARASTHSDGCAANGMNGPTCASLSGNGASCAQADTQTLQTIEDQIRRRGASIVNIYIKYVSKHTFIRASAPRCFDRVCV